MALAIQFTLNGQTVRTEQISPNTTLLEFLRASGRTGTKEGCAEGDCGACSVAIIDRDANGKPAYRAINSCLVPICLLAGREVISVEGVSCEKKLHPVQQKMVECHGSQCGYCTPGFIMSLFEGYYRDDINTADKLDDQLCGNLCRCTGYRPIRDSALEAFAEKRSRGEDSFSKRLKSDATLPSVEYELSGEKFFRPASISELLRILRDVPGARLIAGATELGLDITKRFKKFPALVSVESVEELRTIQKTDSEWRIGAAATLTQIEETVASEFPALADMLRVFGSRQIRNRATMGGNIVTASPIGDSAPVLLAFDAKVILASQKGEREVAISEFFVSYRKTALQAGEILKTIVIPRSRAANGVTRLSRWLKVSKRREMDISTVAGCYVLELDAAKKIQSARLAYGGVAATPVRAAKTERALLGKVWNEQTVAQALPILREEFAPISDVRGSAAYRRELIGSLFEKFYFDVTGATPSNLNPSLLTSAATKALPHESAHKHVNGEAVYTDDNGARKGMLEVWPVCAPHARATILKRDISAAKDMPGVAAVLLAEDVPGVNDVGAVRKDEILLADKEVFFHGQIVALVVGETQEACRAAAAKIVVEYEPLVPILHIEEAIAHSSFHTEANFIRRGEVTASFAKAPNIIEGEFSFGGQEHFYLEMQSACAEPGEDGSMFVMSS
ncbi:MAG: putative xanthine dehydrogenase, partial [Verrucomicrobiales bacterium]|nr:putative xanthine dehydrogenase [Verrucomicrobiales bacterium]